MSAEIRPALLQRSAVTFEKESGSEVLQWQKGLHTKTLYCLAFYSPVTPRLKNLL